MDAKTEVHIDELHTAIIDILKSRFPFLNVQAYQEDRKRIKTPACFIELSDLEVDADLNAGGEQLEAYVNFEAYIIIGFRTPKAKIQIRKLACDVAKVIHNNRFKLPISPAEISEITPDDFNAELDQFEVWRISWRQVIHIGDSVWTADPIPQTMYEQLSKESIVNAENIKGIWHELPAVENVQSEINPEAKDYE